MFMREIEKYTVLIVQKIYDVKISNLPKLMYRFQTISIKIPSLDIRKCKLKPQCDTITHLLVQN